MSRSGARQKILFISHDATRTGAPVGFLHLLRWVRVNTSIPFDILLRNGGPLEDEFRRLGPTDVLHWDNHYVDAGGKQRRLNELASRDYTLVYSNTIANGEILEYLAGLDAPVISHVHELEFRIRHQCQPAVFAGVAAFSDHYFAASQAVKSNLVSRHGVPVDSIDGGVRVHPHDGAGTIDGENN